MVFKYQKVIVKAPCKLGEIGSSVLLKRGHASYFITKGKVFVCKLKTNTENLIKNQIMKIINQDIEKIKKIDKITVRSAVNSVGLLYTSISVHKISNILIKEYGIINMSHFSMKIGDSNTALRSPGKYSIKVHYKKELIKSFILDVVEEKHHS